MTVRHYIEGGGDNRRLGAHSVRAGRNSSKPLDSRPYAQSHGGAVHGHWTFDRFATDAAKRTTDNVPLLLVDSEHPVEAGHSVWQHLRAGDGWDKPVGSGEDDAFLMVQVMETWFLADRDALRKYFGSRIAENALGQWAELENVPKETVLGALRNATERCPKPYAKGRVSFELLAQVDPVRVEASCPHAKALLTRLGG